MQITCLPVLASRLDDSTESYDSDGDDDPDNGDPAFDSSDDNDGDACEENYGNGAPDADRSCVVHSDDYDSEDAETDGPGEAAPTAP